MRGRDLGLGALVLAGGLVMAGPGDVGGASEAPCGAAVRVPAGDFVMGSDETEPGVAPDEQPRHRVYLDAYEIDTYEVANRCFAAFVAGGGYEAAAHWRATGWAWQGREGVTRPALWDDPAWRAPALPVVGVSWFEADAYCRWRGRRLPTEAEWEKAARGGDGRRYPWGQEWGPGRANGDVVAGRLTPVGGYPGGVSPYGAHDMAGNVWEWVQDRYGRDYYRESPASNPSGPADGASRVLRGGSWNFPPRQLRSAARTHLPPETRLRYLGFRCAASP